jgi:hypothetical protein
LEEKITTEPGLPELVQASYWQAYMAAQFAIEKKFQRVGLFLKSGMYLIIILMQYKKIQKKD